jgi:hypothetical protein
LAACGGGGGGTSAATQGWWNNSGKSELTSLASESEVFNQESNLTPTTEIVAQCQRLASDSSNDASSPPPSGTLRTTWTNRLYEVSNLAGDCSNNAGNYLTVLNDAVKILQDELVIQKAAKGEGLN